MISKHHCGPSDRPIHVEHSLTFKPSILWLQTGLALQFVLRELPKNLESRLFRLLTGIEVNGGLPILFRTPECRPKNGAQTSGLTHDLAAPAWSTKQEQSQPDAFQALPLAPTPEP